MPQFLEGWFGHGDDDFPLWLATVRINILLLLAAWALVTAWHLAPARSRKIRQFAPDVGVVAALTAIAAAFRFLVAKSNILDHGGIAYSRLLLGYKGHFATAQFYSLIYQATARDMEHAIAIDRVLGTLTIPIVYLLCRSLAHRSRLFPTIAAGILALYPLHILFSASDVLSVFSVFLSTLSYLLLAGAVLLRDRHRVIAPLHYLGGLLGLALLTQVRYENVLFVIPPAIALLIRRKDVRVCQLGAPLAAFLVLAAIYAYEMTTSGLSYQNPVRLAVGLRDVEHDILFNRFLSLPVLLLGAVAAVARKRTAISYVALPAFAIALALVALTTDSGHHGARVLSNWLVLIVVGCAYGFALLWTEFPRWGKAIAALSLAYLAALPILTRDRLTAQYLEMQENDYFKALWRNLPPDTAWVIVPDDDLMRVNYHSTLEEFTKYAMIRSANGSDRVGLVGITEYLLKPGDVDCKKDRCLFFYGLPCMDQDVYPFTRDQCEQLIKARRVSVVGERETLSAPFVDCSIYEGRSMCSAATKPRRFVTYQIDRQSND